jgi:1,4-dihydroxy-2-naphthoate polyprenyltransferase
LLSFSTMKKGIVVVFFLSFLAGCFLMFRGGWPMAFLCFASILSAILYTAGPYPLGYHGLGDFFVLLFFGPVAVGGTYYSQALTVALLPLMGGMATGLLCTAILVVNNLRDAEGDALAGKRTLVVRFGRTFGCVEYFLCIFLPCLFPLWLVFIEGIHPFVLLSLLILPLAIPLFKTVWLCRDGPSLNDALASTAKLLSVFTFLFSLGWLL